MIPSRRACIASMTCLVLRDCVPTCTTRFVAACRLHHQPAFADVVSAGLFHIDMLARIAGQDRGRGVPVIGRGDPHGIDRRIVQDTSQILSDLASLPVWSWTTLAAVAKRLASTSHTCFTTTSLRRTSSFRCEDPMPPGPMSPTRSCSLGLWADAARASK